MDYPRVAPFTSEWRLRKNGADQLVSTKATVLSFFSSFSREIFYFSSPGEGEGEILPLPRGLRALERKDSNGS
jgi:hypothetical protein